MFGIPLMFMCLTYTGDLLADAFISLYSKMVNLISRKFHRDRMKACSPSSTRQSFEQADVRQIIFFFLSLSYPQACRL